METTSTPMRPADMTCPCGAAADKGCAACKVVFYCSRACQKAAWPAHKAACARTSESWRGAEERVYGAYTPRMRRLLGVRPLCVCVRQESEELGSLVTTIFCPSLDAERSAAVLAIAEEAHADGDCALAFNLYRIAGSPETDQPVLIRDSPGPDITAEELAAVSARVLRSQSAAPGESSGRKLLRGSYQGGNAEAQFRAGIMYMNGESGFVNGRPLVSSACFWLTLAASQGHERAAVALGTARQALSKAKAISSSGGVVRFSYGGDLAPGAGGRLGRR